MVDLAETRRLLLEFQRDEITEREVYLRLAEISPPENAEILRRMAEEELRHYEFWSAHTGVEVGPDRLRVLLYTLAARLLGLTFALRLMEGRESGAQRNYSKVAGEIPGVEDVMRDEERHEAELLGMIEEERLRYLGSVVLGLNDALVELTGAVAGLSTTLRDTTLVAVAASVTGFAASLSMAASEYLSQRSEGAERPGKAALYTGAAYLMTVSVLVAPFFLTADYALALALSLLGGLAVLVAFNFYYSVVREVPFWARFAEMAAVSLGVAALSLAAGYALREALGVGL